MEAPAPSLASQTPGNLNGETETSKDDNNEIISKKSKEFKFSYNNKDFKLIISMTSNKFILIQMEEEDVFTHCFERKMIMNEFFELDKVFKQCDNIEEAYNAITTILNNPKNSIKEIDNDKLIVGINILNLDSSYREKNLQIFKKQQNKDIIIETLCQQIIELKTNNKNIQNELNEIKQKLEKLEKKVNDKGFNLDTNIIQDKKEYDLIIERLKKVNINKDDNIINEESENKNIVLSLLYRATKDGDKAKDFHSKCDKYKNNLTLIKTKKGYKFGGFTCETWEGNGDKKDINAFCFSLNKNKIYNWKKGKSSIFTSPESGPVFGNCIFELRDEFLEMGGLCSEDFFYDNQQSQCEVNGGEEQFEVEEVEVFSVTFQ